MAAFLTSATAPAMRRSSRSLPPSRISKQEGHCDRKEGKTVLFMLDLSKIEKKKNRLHRRKSRWWRFWGCWALLGTSTVLPPAGLAVLGKGHHLPLGYSSQNPRIPLFLSPSHLIHQLVLLVQKVRFEATLLSPPLQRLCSRRPPSHAWTPTSSPQAHSCCFESSLQIASRLTFVNCGPCRCFSKSLSDHWHTWSDT